MKKILVLLFYVLFSTNILAQSFTQCVNEAETRIKQLKEVEKLIASSIKDTDKVVANAQMTPNPQNFIDFTLVRYERNMCKVQLAMVQATTQAANRLCKFIGKDDVVNQTVLAEGIAKYTDMASFSHKYFNDLNESFFNHFSSYLNNYGYDCEKIFREDDMQLLLEYDIF